MKPEIRENLKKAFEEFKDNDMVGVLTIEGHKEPAMEFIVEVNQSRYDELVACERELKILKNALSYINGFSVDELRKVFEIERKEVR